MPELDEFLAKIKQKKAPVAGQPTGYPPSPFIQTEEERRQRTLLEQTQFYHPELARQKAIQEGKQFYYDPSRRIEVNVNIPPGARQRTPPDNLAAVARAEQVRGMTTSPSPVIRGMTSPVGQAITAGAELATLGYMSYVGLKAGIDAAAYRLAFLKTGDLAAQRGVRLAPEEQAGFAQYVTRLMSTKAKVGGIANALFRRNTAGAVEPTAQGAQWMEDNITRYINQYAPVLIPKGTQTGAMIFGGEAANPRNTAAVQQAVEAFKLGITWLINDSTFEIIRKETHKQFYRSFNKVAGRGSYDPKTDIIQIADRFDKVGLHEIGHRFWFRFLPRNARLTFLEEYSKWSRAQEFLGKYDLELEDVLAIVSGRFVDIEKNVREEVENEIREVFADIFVRAVQDKQHEAFSNAIPAIKEALVNVQNLEQFDPAMMARTGQDFFTRGGPVERWRPATKAINEVTKLFNKYQKTEALYAPEVKGAAGSPSGYKRLPAAERRKLYAILKPVVGSADAEKMKDWAPTTILQHLGAYEVLGGKLPTIPGYTGKAVQAEIIEYQERSGRIPADQLVKRVESRMGEIEFNSFGGNFPWGALELRASTKSDDIGYIGFMVGPDDLLIHFIEKNSGVNPALFQAALLKAIRHYGQGKRIYFDSLLEDGSKLIQGLLDRKLIALSNIIDFENGEGDLKGIIASGNLRAQVNLLFRKGSRQPAAGAPPQPPAEPPITAVGFPEDLPDKPEQFTPAQAEASITIMRELLAEPTRRQVVNALRRAEYARRFKNYGVTVAELIAQGEDFDTAMEKGKVELKGKMPELTIDVKRRMTLDMINSLYARLYYTLRNEPSEMAATKLALDNALDGKSIPDKPGTTGRSAWTRLQRLFGPPAPEVKAMGFADQTPLLDEIKKSKGKKFADVVEGVFHEIGREPIPIDKDWQEELRQLSTRGAQEVLDLSIPAEAREQLLLPISDIVGFDAAIEKIKLELMFKATHPPTNVPLADPLTEAERLLSKRRLIIEIAKQEGRITEKTAGLLDVLAQQDYDKVFNDIQNGAIITDPLGATAPSLGSEVDKIIKMPTLFPQFEQNTILNIISQILWSPLDILGAWKGINASLDLSAMRQLLMFAPAHPIKFATAQAHGIQAALSYIAGLTRGRIDESLAKEHWAKITNDLKSYSEYIRLAANEGNDFLRNSWAEKGKEFEQSEEFGALSVERWLPHKLHQLPTTRASEIAFNTTINEVLAYEWKRQVEAAEEAKSLVTAGIIKAPKEGYNPDNELKAIARAIADMTGRAGLIMKITGKKIDFRPVSPVFNWGFFSLRNVLGAILFPRNLLDFSNPRAMAFAWKRVALTIGLIGSIVWLGKQAGWWKTEDDITNAAFGSIISNDGNIVIDPWAGRKSFVTLTARIATRRGISMKTGEEFEVDPMYSIAYYWRSKSSPGLGFHVDVLQGKTFRGEPLDLSSSKQWAERLAPFSAWSIYETATETSVGRAVAVTPLAILGQNVMIFKYGHWKPDFEEYFKLPQDEKIAESKGVMSRSEYREEHPDIDAKLFILGSIPSIRTLAAADYVAKYIRQYKQDPFEISGVRNRLAQYERWAAEGIAPESETPTDILVQWLINKYKPEGMPRLEQRQQIPARPQAPTTPRRSLSDILK